MLRSTSLTSNLISHIGHRSSGALDLAMKHATLTGAQVVLANDPDADRFTAAERNGFIA